MVAIIKRSLRVIAPLLLLMTGVVRGETSYSELTARNSAITQSVDSLQQIITKRRSALATAGDDRAAVEREIVGMEMELFDLNNLRNSLTNKIITLQQSGNINGDTNTLSAESTSSSARQISASPLLKQNLPEEDYENLGYAEQDEAECSRLFTEYIGSYNRLRELKQLYQQAKSESEAIEIEDDFSQLMSSADSLSTLLGDMWCEIYDNKSFAYSMAMELLADNTLIEQQTQLSQASALKIEEIEHDEQSLSALKYDYQKRELITIERELAKRLKMPNTTDSLLSVSAALEKSPAVMDLSPVEFTQRSFIVYEPIKFVTTTPYNTTKNPIPMAAEYQQGVIYRIQLGAYKYEQVPTIFRGTIPLSKDKALGFWTYYAGGFETLKEANDAVQLLMRRGFKRPEIVRWMDGVRRNLYREPLPKSTKYRVVISGAGQLPEEVETIIKEDYPDAILTKIGADRFVVSPITGEQAAEDLITDIKSESDGLSFTITQITQ